MLVRQVRNFELVASYDAVTGNMTARTETDLTALAGAGAPGVRTWSYTYDATGRMTAMDGPLPGADDTTVYGYTGPYLTSVSLPTVNGVAPAWTLGDHDAYGRPQTVTDPNGLVSALAYDGRGRLISRTVHSAQGDAVTTFDYDPRGLLVGLTPPLGGVYSYDYDDARRLLSIEDGTGNRLEVPDYDAMGNAERVTMEDGAAALKRDQQQTFDELGRLLTVLEAGDAARDTVFGYDLNDDLANVTDPLGNETRYERDGLRRVAKAIDASNTATSPACGTAGVTCMAYDVFDNPVAVTDGRGNVTQYLRNGYSEVIERTSPDSGVSSFGYDAAGRVVSRMTADGRTTAWTRDARGRIETAVTTGGGSGGGGSGGGGSGTAICTVVPLLGLSLICEGGTSGDPGDPPPPPTGSSHVVSYAWDTGVNGIGRLASITEPAGITSYVYDDRGNVVSESRDIGTTGTAYVTSYAWDLADNLVRIVWPTGEAVDYARDPLGRITGVDFTATPGGVAAAVASGVTYDPFGPETSSALTLDGVQLASTRTFGLDGRLDRTELTQGTTILHDLSISHDLAGRVDGRTDAVAPSLNESFGYDPVSRLTTASGGYGTLSYDYDAVGNRVSRTENGVTVASTIDTLSNRLVSHGGQPVTHDGAGRITSRTIGGQTQSYTYGLDGRLQSAVAAGVTSSYLHNALGQRISATALGLTRHIHYDLAGRRIAETDGSGALIRAWIWLDGRPALQVSPDGTGGHVVAALAGDQLHQPLALLEDDGTGDAHLSFTRASLPFGGTDTLTADAGVDEPTRLPGQYADPATGLHYNYRRDYDPLLGRYLQPDPIGLAGGDVNLYAYVRNDPLNLVDPTGENPLFFAGLFFVAYSADKIYCDNIVGNKDNLGENLLFLGADLVGLGIGSLGARAAYGAYRAGRLGSLFGRGAGGRLPHGFANNGAFDNFKNALNTGLTRAGFGNTTAILQGSAVTGRKFASGAPFDSGRLSDFDVALAGRDIFARTNALGIGKRGGGIRTGPLGAGDVNQLGLGSLQADLSRMAGRDVNFMVFRSPSDALRRGPSQILK